MKKIYLKAYRSKVSDSQSKGELAAKSIEDKTIIREQILNGLQDFKAKGARLQFFLQKKLLMFRTVTAVKDGVVKPAQALGNTPDLIVFWLAEIESVTYLYLLESESYNFTNSANNAAWTQ